MNEGKKNRKISGMKAKIAYAIARMDEINTLAKSPAWATLNPMEQEFYAAENAAWKTVVRIVNIRLKIELGKAARAKKTETGK